VDGNSKFPKAALRRKDYITYLAVGLFIFVIGFEILLVTWLPRKLHNTLLWQDQVACEEMIELEDLLRAYMIDIKPRQSAMRGEIELMQSCLNEIAGYLREYKDNLTREQTDQIFKQLKYFESIFTVNIKNGKSFVQTEKMNPAPFIERLRKTSVSSGTEAALTGGK